MNLKLIMAIWLLDMFYIEWFIREYKTKDKKMSKVIAIDFISRARLENPPIMLTHTELVDIESRIDEITEALDICDSERDAEIIEALEYELDALMAKVENSLLMLENKGTQSKLKGRRRKNLVPKLVA